MADAASPSPVRAGLRRYGLQAAILTAGIVAAVVIIASHSRDRVTFAIPLLVLSIVLTVAVTFADHRPRRDRLQRAAEGTGLTADGPGPVPPVTPILRAVREPVADLLTGDLQPGGPTVHLTRTRLRRGGDAVVLWTDAPIRGPLTADPHGLTPDGAARPADEDASAFAREHPLGLALAVEEGTLVLAAPVPRGGDAPYAELLAAAREARRRLVANG